LIQFDSRGSSSTFGDDCFDLCPHQYSSTRGARHPPLATTPSAFALVDIVRLEGLALYSGDDDFSLRQSRHDSTPGTRLLPSATTASAFAIVDSVQLEGAWHRLLRNHDDDDFDYDPQRTFAPSATNPGQEGLGRDHGRLAEPGGEGLPGARERRPRGVTGFGKTKSSTSTTSTTSATLE